MSNHKATFSTDPCILELRDRVEALEAKRSGAVGMSIADEILVYHSLLAAQSPGKAVFHGKAAVETTPPPVATDEELKQAWLQGATLTQGNRALYDLGVAHGQAGSRELAEPAPVAGGLVERITLAIDRAPFDEGDHLWDEARAAILEVARWMRDRGWVDMPDALEQEAGR
jgi:hypothetical protein